MGMLFRFFKKSSMPVKVMELPVHHVDTIFIHDRHYGAEQVFG